MRSAKLISLPQPQVFIRRATVLDTPSVVALGEAVHLSSNSVESEGFLCHSTTEEEYRPRLARGRFNHVAVVDNKIVGFLSAMSSNELTSFLDAAIVQYEPVVLEALRSAGGSSFMLVDQASVYPKSFRRQRVAEQLLNALTRLSVEHGITSFVGTISQHPEANLASMGLIVKHLGFTPLKTIESNGRRWLLVHKQVFPQ
jgi:hypothetical protein